MLRKKLIGRFDCRFELPTQSPPVTQKADGGTAKPENLNERTAPRLEARLVATVEAPAGCHVGFTENVSEGGTFVSTKAPQNVGDEVSLVIALPDLALIRARGTVRWLRAPSKRNGMSGGIGIRFERLSPLDAVRMQDFLATRRAMLFDDETGVRRRPVR
jgi:uncharacterized protein (TIGR02266 family)